MLFRFQPQHLSAHKHNFHRKKQASHVRGRWGQPPLPGHPSEASPLMKGATSSEHPSCSGKGNLLLYSAARGEVFEHAEPSAPGRPCCKVRVLSKLSWNSQPSWKRPALHTPAPLGLVPGAGENCSSLGAKPHPRTKPSSSELPAENPRQQNFVSLSYTTVNSINTSSTAQRQQMPQERKPPP